MQEIKSIMDFEEYSKEKTNTEIFKEVAMKCFFSEEEVAEGKVLDQVVAQGIMNNFGFHKERLEENKPKIIFFLNEMNDRFREGVSFIELAHDRHGVHWAEHPTIELLVCLGMAIDKVKYFFPREMWNLLPGGMPYVIYKP